MTTRNQHLHDLAEEARSDLLALDDRHYGLEVARAICVVDYIVRITEADELDLTSPIWDRLISDARGVWYRAIGREIEERGI